MLKLPFLNGAVCLFEIRHNPAAFLSMWETRPFQYLSCTSSKAISWGGGGDILSRQMDWGVGTEQPPPSLIFHSQYQHFMAVVHFLKNNHQDIFVEGGRHIE